MLASRKACIMLAAFSGHRTFGAAVCSQTKKNLEFRVLDSSRF